MYIDFFGGVFSMNPDPCGHTVIFFEGSGGKGFAFSFR